MVGKNLKDNRNLHDGLTWTFNSVEAMLKYFPYFTYNQLRRIITKLKKAGIIKISNYNLMAYDKTRWYSFTELGEKLLGICVHYEEKTVGETTNPGVNKNTSICEKIQIEESKITNDMVENTSRTEINHKPIPDIETNIENTDIEKSVIANSSGAETAAPSIRKPLALSFLSEKAFVKRYQEVEAELFSEKQESAMTNIFSGSSNEDRYDVVVAELKRRLQKKIAQNHERNFRRLEKEHNNSEALKIIEKHYGQGQQLDDLDSLGKLYKEDGWFYFNMYIEEAARLGITDGRAIYAFGMKQKQVREERKELREAGVC